MDELVTPPQVVPLAPISATQIEVVRKRALCFLFEASLHRAVSPPSALTNRYVGCAFQGLIDDAKRGRAEDAPERGRRVLDAVKAACPPAAPSGFGTPAVRHGFAGASRRSPQSSRVAQSDPSVEAAGDKLSKALGPQVGSAQGNSPPCRVDLGSHLKCQRMCMDVRLCYH